jgi:hypothetical protein
MSPKNTTTTEKAEMRDLASLAIREDSGLDWLEIETRTIRWRIRMNRGRRDVAG